MHSNRILIAVIVLMTTACSNWEPARCPSGRLCQSGAMCAADQDICITTPCGNGIMEEQENETCDDGNIIIGDGCDNLCQLEGCGNSKLNPGEVCDDGNLKSSDGCSATCESEACGDGDIDEDFGETCDDGNKISGDGCNSYCLKEYCGNGIVDRAIGEACDDGNDADGDGCSAKCVSQFCGNGTLDPSFGELCDDGNDADSDGCSALCQVEICGNGILDPEEACDDGNTDNTDDCLTSCQEASCGDGFVHLGDELCDDGNGVTTDACPDGPSGTCEPARCGDGVIRPGSEICDDGDGLINDECPDGPGGTCEPARCGDGIVHTGKEACDDRDTVSGDGCSAECLSEFCGNGIVDPHEVCDDGNKDDTDDCLTDCQAAFCGDGFVHQNDETCDDGNRRIDDDCPDGPKGTCERARCGDGIVHTDKEACDDGNTEPGDGCNAECRSEVCGNGNEDSGETCDDGNTEPGDGCSALCQDETCGNGILDPGEACDDGNKDDTDDCPTSCQEAFCGDRLVHRDDEMCDDGNSVTTDACPDGPSGTCEPARCGDNFIFSGSEACDDGNNANGDGCSADCRSNETCGNAVVDSANNEICDDGNDMNGDGCETDCTPTTSGPIAIAAGGYHTCVVLNTNTVRGAVRCWGDNDYGQLGYRHTNPIGDNEVPAMAENVNVGGPVKELAAGYRHTCALLENGKVRCWGLNASGQLGYRHTRNIGDDEVPASAGDVDVGGPVKALAAGDWHTCALLENGQVRCWGLNDSGQLGYGHTEEIGDNEVPSSVGTVNVGGPVKAITAGDYHTCALLENGQVRCWGLNNHGQLGYGNTTQIGDTEVPSSVGTVNVGGPVIALGAGDWHTCALLEDRAVRCWGRNNHGQLGYGNTDQIGDTEVPSSVGAVNVGPAVEISGGEFHTCVRLATGAVRCWGHSLYGELGYGNTLTVGDEPNELPSAAVDVGGAVTAIAADEWHTCAVLETRAVRCWGLNNFGQLGYGHTSNIGDNELPSASAPVRILERQ